MNFVSWAFFLLFLPVLVARLTIGRRRTELPFFALVMVASTIFVCWHIPAYILVMLISIGVDYAAAILIHDAPAGARRRKAYLAISMATSLALLGFFKYANFAMDQAGWLSAHLLQRPMSFPRMGLLLPMGISFYTFGSMSYTIDVYRGRMKPVRRFLHFYYFLTFFPHMVAGPIIRAEQFFYQMWRRRRPSLRVFNEGMYQIIRGLFLKMACADNIAGAVNGHWSEGYAAGTPAGRLAALAVLFAAQIFCDFEGYSSIARGLAYLLGYRFPINFNNPYLAGSFSNFWERWHITLSRWLRDYLYIPLGGNRGAPWRTYANLMIVMVLGGLWHGAAMTFVAWGALHGAALAAERLLGMQKPQGGVRRALRVPWYVLVQAVVLVTWILFRSDTLGHAGVFLGNIAAGLGRPLGGVVEMQIWGSLAFVAPVVIMHLHGHLVERRWIRPLGRAAQAVLAAIMLFAVLSCYGQSNDFIYFRF